MMGVIPHYMAWLTFVLLCIVSSTFSNNLNFEAGDSYENLFRVDYPYNDQLLSQLRDCDIDNKSCDDHVQKLYTLSAKITNEHNVLMVNDRAQQLFEDILYFLGTSAPKYRAKVCHILNAIQFSNGNVRQVSPLGILIRESFLEKID